VTLSKRAPRRRGAPLGPAQRLRLASGVAAALLSALASCNGAHAPAESKSALGGASSSLSAAAAGASAAPGAADSSLAAGSAQGGINTARAGAATTLYDGPATEPAVPQQTTRGDIAVGNLDDRIQSVQRRLARSPTDLPVRAHLIDLLLMRTQFLGSFADFAQVRELADGAVHDFPKQPQAHLLLARALSAVHRFGDAERELDAADALGAPDTAPQRASIHIAEGHDLDAALALAKQRAEKAPTLEHLSLWAQAEAALGHFDAAEAQYLAALQTYHDVSPFPVAYLLFQRGVMWAELADAPERALPIYAEAVRRLPEYVVANVHLAELEIKSGHADAASQRLQRLVDHTSDPEPLGVLGQLLLDTHPEDPRGKQLIARAQSGYEALLSQHRDAFLDHAAEFFAGPGAAPRRALELAQANLTLRQTGRAYILAIKSALAANDPKLACSYIAQAEKTQTQSKNLQRLILKETPLCSAG
jgi:tetratricopeptide repeat protein